MQHLVPPGELVQEHQHQQQKQQKRNECQKQVILH